MPRDRTASIFSLAKIGPMDFVLTVRVDLMRSYALLIGFFSFAWCIPLSSEAGPAFEITVSPPHNVEALAISPNNSIVATAGNHSVTLWEVRTGIPIRSWTAHSGLVRSVAFSPTDGTFATAGLDGAINIWEVSSGKRLAILKRDGCNEWEAVAFSPDNRFIAAAGCEIVVWDIKTRRPLPDPSEKLKGIERARKIVQKYINNKGGCYSIAFSPDSKRLIVGCDDTARVFKTTSYNIDPAWEMTGASEFISVAFSHDGNYYLAANKADGIGVWESRGGQLVRTFQGGGRFLSVLPGNSAFLASSSERNTKSRMLDIDSGAEISVFDGNIATLSADGKLAAVCNETACTTYDPVNAKPIKHFSNPSDRLIPYGAAISPNGKQLLVAGKAVGMINLSSGRLESIIQSAEARKHQGGAHTFTPDGSLAIFSDREEIVIWNVRDAKEMRRLATPGIVVDLQISPDGMTLFAACQIRSDYILDEATNKYVAPPILDTGLRAWSIASGMPVGDLRAGSENITQISLFDNGKRLLGTGGFQDKVFVWEVPSGRLVATHIMPAALITAVSVAQDRFAILADYRGKISILDLGNGSLRVLKWRCDGRITHINLSTDHKQFIVASDDGALRVADLKTGSLTKSIRAHGGSVVSAEFTSGERSIVSSSTDGTVKTWEWPSGNLLATTTASQKGDWLTVTPDGFFSGSGGSNLLSISRDLSVTTVDQIFQSLYNPDLVREALAGDPSQEVEKASRVMNLDKVFASGEPPEVSIKSPLNDAEALDETMAIDATLLNRGGGIGRVEWRVNGITAAVSQVSSSESVVQAKAVVSLDQGDNIVEVVAYNRANAQSSHPTKATVTYAATNVQKPTLHVLAVGINEYTDTGNTMLAPGLGGRFAKLRLAAKDATAIGEAFRRAAGDLYENVNVETVLDASATKGELERIVSDLGAKVALRDTVVIFVAAHGVAKDGRFFLIPQDYQGIGPTPLDDFAIGESILQDWLTNRIKARKVLLMLDTCESGAAVGGVSRSRFDTASDASVGRLHEATGRIILTAAAAGQYAYEGNIGATAETHGLFTWAALEALREGDLNRNGRIEISELVGHVQEAVPKLAAAIGGSGRAASSIPQNAAGQSARVGSRGEDFSLVRRDQ